ncbi:MAG: hypothetical protein V2J24_16210, partial [Pseudomonadales bacterium]|nr:hypothetical protein [Pseudomonadales bacterium]
MEIGTLATPSPSPFARLPGVDAVLCAPELESLVEDWGRALVGRAVRETLDGLRGEIAAGAAPKIDVAAVAARTGALLGERPGRGPRPVLNLT